MQGKVGVRIGLLLVGQADIEANGNPSPFCGPFVGCLHDAGASAGDNDELHGDFGDDQLYGNGGDDKIRGGPGADTLIAGAGDDVMVFDSPLSMPAALSDVIANS